MLVSSLHSAHLEAGMSRLLLCALVSWAALASNTSARADEFEDLAVAVLSQIVATVTEIRDALQAARPV